MFEFYNEFSEFIDIPLLIWGAIKFALLSFIVALLLLFLGKRWVLVTRQNRVLKYLAYTYYFFIPVICLCAGFYYGGISTSRDHIIDRIPTYQATIQSTIEQTLGLDNIIIIYYSGFLDQTIDEAYTQYVLLMQTKLDLFATNKPGSYIISKAIAMGVSTIIKAQIKKQIIKQTALDSKLVDELLEIKLTNILTSKTVTKIFTFYVNKISAMVLMPVKIIWGLLLLFPVLEIALANYFRRKYLKYEAQQKAYYMS